LLTKLKEHAPYLTIVLQSLAPIVAVVGAAHQELATVGKSLTVLVVTADGEFPVALPTKFLTLAKDLKTLETAAAVAV
jgi:hypothetical protein